MIFIIEIAVLIAIILGCILLIQGTRKVPVNYAKQIVGNRQFGGARQFLPLKVNSAGVMPIIFAQAIMFLPTLFNLTSLASTETKQGIQRVFTDHTDIWYMLIFGVVGYFCKKLDYPIAPMVLALVLGDMAESALRQSLIMSQGSPLIFITRPISAVLVVLSLGLFVSPGIQALLRRWRQGAAGQLEARADL